MQSFYKLTGVNDVALTFEQEIKLLRCWKARRSAAGTITERKARDTLVKNYVLFAVKTAKSFYKALAEDDAHRVAYMTLLLSIDKWREDREKVGRIANMIPLYVKVAYRKYKRDSELVKCPAKNETEGRYVSLDAEVNVTDGMGHLRENHELGVGNGEEGAPEVDLDILLGVEDPTIDKEVVEERKMALRKAITTLEPRQLAVISFVYYQKLDFAATARKMKPACSREWVRQLHDKALKTLRTALVKSEEN